jgi:hypothetical protein
VNAVSDIQVAFMGQAGRQHGCRQAGRQAGKPCSTNLDNVGFVDENFEGLFATAADAEFKPTVYIEAIQERPENSLRTVKNEFTFSNYK